MEYQSIEQYETMEKTLGYFNYLFTDKEKREFSKHIGNFAAVFVHNEDENGFHTILKPLDQIRSEYDNLSIEDMRLLFYGCKDMQHRGKYNPMFTENFCPDSDFKNRIGRAVKARIPFSYAKYYLSLDCGPSQVYHAVAEKVWNGEKIEKDMLAGLPLHADSIYR